MSRQPAYLIRPEATGCEARRIAPFGNLGIKVCLPLPRAYRSLPRPSSSCDAKASTVRPFALDRAFRFQSENTISVLMLYNLLLPAARRLRGVRLLLFHSALRLSKIGKSWDRPETEPLWEVASG